MTAARKFKSHSKDAQWRSRAYAAINIAWKRMSPENDRDERLAWIEEYLQLKPGSLRSTKDLTDDQLGPVAGEMKRLTGQTSQTAQRRYEPRASGNVVAGDFGRDRDGSRGDDHDVVHLASPEQVYTLDKLQAYLKWSPSDVFEFIKKRVLKGKARLSGSVPNFHMLTFRQATTAVNALLHVAAHRDLKVHAGGVIQIKRTDVERYIPLLKQQLQIDRRK